MENNKNKKSVKFQGDMLNFYDFIRVFVFTTNHHLKAFNSTSRYLDDLFKIDNTFFDSMVNHIYPSDL